MRSSAAALCALLVCACTSEAEPDPADTAEIADAGSDAAEDRWSWTPIALPTTSSRLSIVVDGRFDDWRQVPEVAPGIRVANDDVRLLIAFTVESEIGLGEGSGAPILYIDADDDPATGAPYEGMGVELFFNLGQASGSVYDGPPPGEKVRWADLNLIVLPTVSASRFELALDRRPEWQPGTRLRVELGGHSFPVVIDAQRSSPPEPLSTEQPAGTLRVMTWNMLMDGLLDPERANAYREVLLATRPDVIAFQEVKSPAETIGQRVAAILEHPDGGEWHTRGYGGRVVVSRYPIVEGWPASFLSLNGRFQVVGIELPSERRFILVNAHMSCCSNDQGRLEEAESFAKWMVDLTTPGGEVDAPPGSHFALVGDLNLVGSSAPLNVLLSAKDFHGEPLVNLSSRHQDQPVGYTWRFPKGAFWPGLLDYVIYGADTLVPANHFIVGESPSTTTASDHLPRIVDFAPRPD